VTLYDSKAGFHDRRGLAFVAAGNCYAHAKANFTTGSNRLRAAMRCGANDGVVSILSLMIGATAARGVSN
jgi:hypothetical protein